MTQIAVWWDPTPADPAAAMAADELLADEARRRQSPLLRFYRWRSPTLSLGAFQSIAEMRALEAVDGLHLVRRPSGGGAIVHGTDLTYAIALPSDHAWSRHPEPLYAAMHQPLVDELTSQGLRARLHAAGSRSRSSAPPPSTSESFFCFSRRSPGDVVVDDEDDAHPGDRGKILGGAQRRLAGVVVQHGSLLLRANAQVPPAWRHLGVEEHGGPGVDAAQPLARGWTARLAVALGAAARWEADPFTVGRETRIAALAARHRDARWLERR